MSGEKGRLQEVSEMWANNRRREALNAATTETERATLANALRVAIEQYELDVVTCRKAGDVRTADQFVRQAAESRELLERFE